MSAFGNLSSGHKTGKRSAFIPIPKKGNAKECSNYHIDRGNSKCKGSRTGTRCTGKQKEGLGVSGYGKIGKTKAYRNFK